MSKRTDHRDRRRAGFTLVELLLSVICLSMLSVGSLTLFQTVQSVWLKNLTVTDLLSVMELGMDRVSRAVRPARQISPGPNGSLRIRHDNATEYILYFEQVTDPYTRYQLRMSPGSPDAGGELLVDDVLPPPVTNFQIRYPEPGKPVVILDLSCARGDDRARLVRRIGSRNIEPEFKRV